MRALVTVDAVGGVWRYALDLACGLRDEGIEGILALTGPAPMRDARQEAATAGVTLVETGLGLDWLEPDPERMRAAAARIAELAGDLHADIAHLNAPAFATARFAMPTLAVAHSCLGSWWRAVKDEAMPPDFAWRDDVTRAGLLAAGRAAAPSRAHAEATMRAHGLSRLPAVVHNGRTPVALGSGGAPAYAAFTAGRLWDKGKGVRVLDDAAAQLAAPFEAAGALRGPQGETIAPRHLRCLGQIDGATLAQRLAARPVFASAARYEPFGLAVLEAAQAGCALVLADIPTFRELWQGAATFVAADDAAGFARAIATLLDDPAARAAAGDAARRAAARYTVRAMAAGTAALYRTLAEGTLAEVTLGGGTRAAA